MWGSRKGRQGKRKEHKELFSFCELCVYLILLCVKLNRNGGAAGVLKEVKGFTPASLRAGEGRQGKRKEHKELFSFCELCVLSYIALRETDMSEKYHVFLEISEKVTQPWIGCGGRVPDL